MTKSELIEGQEELFKKNFPEYVTEKNVCLSPYWDLWQAAAEFGYNKAMKEWRDCFMSCSSPYCADKFRDIQCNGMLGNMTKEVKMEEAKQKVNTIRTGVDEYIMGLEEENRKLREKNKALERYAELCRFTALDEEEEADNESHI